MLSAEIHPTGLRGSLKAPPSKSMAHRAIICASLAQGISIIDNCPDSKDIAATAGAMRALGARIEGADGTIECDGSETFAHTGEGRLTLDCNESGSTLRFLIPVAGLAGCDVTFTGRHNLINRPLKPYFDMFDRKGITYTKPANGEANLPFTLTGKFREGKYGIRGDISSQFISGLLLALPLCRGDSEITLESPLESAAYVEMTLDVMRNFGVEADEREGSAEGMPVYVIQGGQRYRNANFTVEGDFSQAAFWLVAGALGSEVECGGLNLDTLQGDAQIIEVIRRLGYKIDTAGGALKAVHTDTWADPPVDAVIDCSQIPDLVPVMAALAALTHGRTEFRNAARLRIKESDRLAAIAQGLSALGAKITEMPDRLVVEGVRELHGGTADSFNDHRIAMALAVAATRSTGNVTIKGHLCVDKSYPHFWDDYIKLGGNVHERDLGD